ncbi:hypothetical protein, partial [Treponema endosymbiont of Eucomonympha sp.]|uniref:hypothetical protein n=1 Tax=Treponema endosymbiont of Eucomonympha sp. TaxID=1580831 RepID=UPI000A6CFF1C
RNCRRARGAGRTARSAKPPPLGSTTGEYTFYFKNGKEASGDCDGYSSDFGGKTTIYEWWQSDINGWEKRLKAAGINPEVYRTSASKYCWARFDTDLLYGTGLYKHRPTWGFGIPSAYFRMNGKETKVSSADDLKYARAGGAFNWRPDTNEEAVKSASEVQKNRDAPGLCLIVNWRPGQTVSALRRAGAGTVYQHYERIGHEPLDHIEGRARGARGHTRKPAARRVGL